MNIEQAEKAVLEIARVGREHPLSPDFGSIEIFAPYVNQRGGVENLDARDGSCIRRELLARFLLLCAVLDQGPDIEGVRQLLSKVLNHLYGKEVRILHRPIDFFKEINVSVDQIMEKHKAIKRARQHEWAAANNSTANKYNLFMDNTKQALNYAAFRWGVPLLLPYLLEKKAGENPSGSVLLDYLEGYKSAEEMSQQLKDHEKYGMGKAIGDKACHLFVKWMVSTFSLIRKKNDEAWDNYSFETPYDSNAGRVLWRTGYFLLWADEAHYVGKDAVQKSKGKGGAHYLRVTNIRGMKTECISPQFMESYKNLHINRRQHKADIHRLQHVFLKKGGMTPAEFDDGLIHIGRNYCLNHQSPKCGECPLRDLCDGHLNNPDLINNYRT